MELKNVFCKFYIANIIIENQWGYHRDSLWYGADTKNLALMIMDLMNSWYLPNKDVMGPEIVKFYERLEAATKDPEEGDSSVMPLTFKELTGEKFNSNGLRLQIVTTNNLWDMYNLVVNETFGIFASKGENPTDFNGLGEFINYLENTYEIDPPIMAALKTPNEATVVEALYLIDMKYDYTGRHFRNPKVSSQN